MIGCRDLWFPEGPRSEEEYEKRRRLKQKDELSQLDSTVRILPEDIESIAVAVDTAGMDPQKFLRLIRFESTQFSGNSSNDTDLQTEGEWVYDMDLGDAVELQQIIERTKKYLVTRDIDIPAKNETRLWECLEDLSEVLTVAVRTEISPRLSQR